MLDSIQFLFELGFVPLVALSVSYRDRAAVVEAVRREIDREANGDPLLLGAWPRGAAAAAAASAAAGGTPSTNGVDGRSDRGAMAPPLGLRVLSTSR